MRINVIRFLLFVGILILIGIYCRTYIFTKTQNSIEISTYENPEFYSINLEDGFHRQGSTNIPHRPEYWKQILDYLSSVTGGLDVATDIQVKNAAEKGIENQYTGWSFDKTNNKFVCLRPYNGESQEGYWNTKNRFPEFEVTSTANIRDVTGGCGINVFGRKPKIENRKDLESKGIIVYPFSYERWSIFDKPETANEEKLTYDDTKFKLLAPGKLGAYFDVYKSPYNWYGYQWITVNGDVSKEITQGDVVTYQPGINKQGEKVPVGNYVVRKVDLKGNLTRLLLDNSDMSEDFSTQTFDNFYGEPLLFKVKSSTFTGKDPICDMGVVKNHRCLCYKNVTGELCDKCVEGWKGLRCSINIAEKQIPVLVITPSNGELFTQTNGITNLNGGMLLEDYSISKPQNILMKGNAFQEEIEINVTNLTKDSQPKHCNIIISNSFQDVQKYNKNKSTEYKLYLN